MLCRSRVVRVSSTPVAGSSEKARYCRKAGWFSSTERFFRTVSRDFLVNISRGWAFFSG